MAQNPTRDLKKQPAALNLRSHSIDKLNRYDRRILTQQQGCAGAPPPGQSQHREPAGRFSEVWPRGKLKLHTSVATAATAPSPLQ
jgi:hypothetical protein